MAIQKVQLAFGLITIPVSISPAARDEHVSFNLLHDECKHRINQKTFCGHCDKEISRRETVKGYEVEKDSFVILNDEDFKEVEPASSKVMEIVSTVNLSEIDPVLFDASYWLEPEPAGRKGYKLLLTALLKEKKAAVAKLTMHGREHVVIIRPLKTGLMFHTMFFADEVREVPVGELDDVTLKPKELELARELVNASAEPFEHAAYKDDYRQALLGMIEDNKNQKPRSAKGKKPMAVAPGPDILEILAASIKRAKKVA